MVKTPDKLPLSSSSGRSAARMTLGREFPTLALSRSCTFNVRIILLPYEDLPRSHAHTPGFFVGRPSVSCFCFSSWRLSGSVANFAQEMLKGQLPLSVGGLCGQGGELFGRGEALLDSVFQLLFSQHVHQFDADER
jgi:hypothetical protein